MQQIDTADALPEPGTLRESQHFDFKKTVAIQDHEELAKDVAALASAFGGHIIVGAVEDRSTGKLERFDPLPEDFAHEVQRAYDRAVKERCSPVPLHDARVLPREGRFVVIVTAFAFAGQAVGVRVEKDAFIFPLRIGAETLFLWPEQLPMLMLPQERRNAVLLDSIAKHKRKGICAIYRMPQMKVESMITRRSFLELVEVRLLENVAVFRGEDFGPAGYTRIPTAPPLHIPLDGIESVWPIHGGDWYILLKGQIQTAHEGRSVDPIYVPNG